MTKQSQNFIYCVCSFCLEAKEPKIQDLETPAKNNLYSLKILNSRELCIVIIFQKLSRAQTVEFF